MSLRLKVAIIIIGIFLFYGIANFGIQKFIIFPSFLSLEQEEAIKDSKRVKQAIDREIHHLDYLVHDWAARDDTYTFVDSPSSDYIKANLSITSFTDNNLNLIYICDKDGKVIWGEIHDPVTKAKMHMDCFPKDRIPKTNPLISYKTENKPLSIVSVFGVYITSKGPMIINSRPILKSSDEGPSRGTLIMGRFLTAQMVKNLADYTRVDFQIFPVQANSIPETMLEILTKITDKSPYLIEAGKEDNQMLIYTAYPDIEGKTALLIKSKISRKIAVKGLAAIHYAMFLILAAGLGAFIVILLLLNRAIFKPITRLTDHAMEVRKTNDLSKRISIQRKDEIGILADEFDEMLIQLGNRSIELEELNTKLQEDIDKRRQTEESLRESETYLRAVLDSTADGILVIGPTGKVLSINQRFAGFWQIPVEALKSSNDKALMDFISDQLEDAPDFLKEVHRLYGTDEESFGTIRLKNGRIFEWFTLPVRIDDRRRGRLWSLHDITERKLAEKVMRENEKKLARSKKMESLGLLAGGVAHDLNNVLSGIVSYPELILMDLPEDSKLRNPIKTMQESGHRAAAIVQDLLTVAQGVADIKELLNLNDLINDYLHSPMFNKLKQFYPAVTVKTNLDMDLLNIVGSPAHIKKAVMNLVSNASEAIKESGNITISTVNRYVDRALRGYDDVNIGEYIVLSVSDNGPGISSDDIERIFEPFYTKKVMGRSGTGLGLAVVWSVVQDHKGYIDITTDENGTTFELYFPVTRRELSVKNLPISINGLKGNGEMILVVDDEKNQREISCKMLEILGYKAKAVSSGEKAVEYLKKHTVDLLLLDMIMDPGINGRETYERVIEIHPNQKAIIASGFAETDEVKKIQQLGTGKYIKKPLTLEKIGMAIKDELGK